MAISRRLPANKAGDRPARGARFDVTAEGDATFGTIESHESTLARIDGSFAGGGADANSVTIEHSWDGTTWAAAGNASVTGNVAAQAVVGDLRPHKRVVIASAGAATFTGTVDFV